MQNENTKHSVGSICMSRSKSKTSTQFVLAHRHYHHHFIAVKIHPWNHIGGVDLQMIYREDTSE